MSPQTTACNVVHGGMGQSMRPSERAQIFARGVGYSDGPNEVIGEHGVRVHFTPRHTLTISTGAAQVSTRGTTLAGLVSVVCCDGAQPQVPHPAILDPVNGVDSSVIISDACRRIAGVSDDQPGRRPFAGGEPPSVDVRTHITLLNGTKLSVSVLVGVAGPCPTGITEGNLRPETIMRRKDRTGAACGNPARLRAVGARLCRALVKRRSALFADPRRRRPSASDTIVVHRLSPVGGVTPPADLAIGAGVSCVNYTRPLQKAAALSTGPQRVEGEMAAQVNPQAAQGAA